MHNEEDVAGKVSIEKDTEGSMVGKGISRNKRKNVVGGRKLRAA